MHPLDLERLNEAHEILEIAKSLTEFQGPYVGINMNDKLLVKRWEGCYFPSGEFLHAVWTWWKTLTEVQREKLYKYTGKDTGRYAEYDRKMAILDGDLARTHSGNNSFYYLIKQLGVIDPAIDMVSKFDRDTQANYDNHFLSLPDIEICTVCNEEFDNRQNKKNCLNQTRCPTHTIKRLEDVTETTQLSETSKELQDIFWSRIVDRTANELSDLGIVKIEESNSS